MVVLPEPFTPSTSTTCGFAARASGSPARLDARELLGDRLAQHGAHRLGAAVRRLAPHALEQVLRRRDAEVGAEQQRLELVEQRPVEAALAEQAAEAPEQRVAGAREALAEAGRGRRRGGRGARRAAAQARRTGGAARRRGLRPARAGAERRSSHANPPSGSAPASATARRIQPSMGAPA